MGFGREIRLPALFSGPEGRRFPQVRRGFIFSHFIPERAGFQDFP
jgi:hypothetical protein